MPTPFGGHPNLAKYLIWLRDEHNIWFQSGTAVGKNGGNLPLIRIVGKLGPINIVGMKQTEFLSPSQVDNLDRRLGIKSPWGFPEY